MSPPDRELRRRTLVTGSVAAGGLVLAAGCDPPPASPAPSPALVLASKPLGFLWETVDPFLFCAHHNDAYPAGNSRLGPAAALSGRQLGNDFGGRDGWSMYHGEQVPGFPQHPHRGFETVTVVRHGLVDHADSLGATARYGDGDVQWMTAGRGIVHAEMFPLLKSDQHNPLELFQVWLNLPAQDKLVEPHFTMLWRDAIPHRALIDAAGHKTIVTMIAGSYDGTAGGAPPPKSWAAHSDSDVTIWTIDMDPAARFTIPAARSGVRRMLYFFGGSALTVGDRAFDAHAGIEVVADREVPLAAGADRVELLVLQGRPIGEPVARHGPFVMNTTAEIERAYSDFRATGFGGWPWPDRAPVHDRSEGRFALHVGGRRETPT